MSTTLPQLKVASPCPVSWDSMRGDDRSRFCEQCQLHVHNVSAMSRVEANRLIATSPGRVCMSGFMRPDGELVTRDQLVSMLNQEGAPAWRIAAVRAALAAGLTVSALSLAGCHFEMGGGAVESAHQDPTSPTAQPSLGIGHARTTDAAGGAVNP